MQLIAHRDVREPDLAHIESPIFAFSKVRTLLLGSSPSTQMLGISNFSQPAPAFDSPRRNDELLREVESGDWFLVILSSPGPFRPAVRWQSGNDESADGRWIVDESLSPTERFKLEHVIARIEREKRLSRPQQEILAISGTPRSGILKRYANFFSAHQAFPEHLTAAEEKGWGSSIRGLYGGNDTIQNQADITAFNDTPSVLGVTHGQIFDAMENVVAVAGLIEGGLGLAKLRDLGKVAGTVSSGSHNQMAVVSTTQTKIPLGFGQASDFEAFSNSIHSGLESAGYENVDVAFQGSSVTGRAFNPPHQPFDAARVSDYDIALASPELFQNAKDVGIGLRQQGTRTGPLRPEHLEKLRLSELNSQLTSEAGRPVNFMIYQSIDDAIIRSPSILTPRTPQ